MVAPPARRFSPRAVEITPSRIAAGAILAEIRDGRLLDQALDQHTGALDPRDKRWTRELVSGLLRERGRVDAWIGARATGGIARLDADLVDLLRLGVYQLLFMDSVPAYAAIGQMVELVKTRHGIGASKLANAILRRIDRERDSLHDEIDALGTDTADCLATRYSHPAWLVARYIERLGHDATRDLLIANNSEAFPSLRPWGIDAEALRTALREANVPYDHHPLDPECVPLSGSASVPSLPWFEEGRFFVQDPAATLVTRYAAVPTGSRVLDLCAAPGGKAIELSRTASQVIAADRSAARLERVKENLARLRVTNVQPMVADAITATFEAADAVLVDAPCTGTGTFRRHPDARWRLRISDLHVSAALQRDILTNAARAVSPGGLLIYSTCSLEPEENDEQVTWFLDSHPEFVLEAPPVGVVPESVISEGLLKVLPHLHACDGAFAARFRRREIA